MRKKIYIAIYSILIFIAMYLLYVNFTNIYIVNKYNHQEYLEKNAKILTILTLNKSYVANYNYGNILYQNKEYEQAIIEYKKAMHTVKQKEKDCKIRINCALAICGKTSNELDESNQESIEKAIEQYESAIEILKENQCSSHNEEAKKLQQDIEKEIERLRNLQKSQNSQNNEQNQEEQQEDEEQQKKKNPIEEKLNKMQEEAIKAKQENEEFYKNYNKERNPYYTEGKNW